VSVETLFGNVPSLIRVHQSFWEEVLEPSLEETRASGQPLNPISLQSGFLTVSLRKAREDRIGRAWSRL
jgi:hypothetical protein